MASVETYVKQKNEAAALHKAAKNWRRKIEIAEIAYKECKKLLRKKVKRVEEMENEFEE